ncbi:hypothetical protein [Arthrobacter sp. NPDC090010]|uniref:hypothetical protein n=1 Tax=Arthrobacter sp. NPDC090010 TaxID=3363942 RepID=UPI00381982F4
MRPVAEEVLRLVQRRTGPVRFLLFAPGLSEHPVSEAGEVFTQACTDLGEEALLLGETALLFAGLQARNLFARRVESVGFLVTDQAVHVRDTPSTPVEDSPVRAVEFDWSAAPAAEAQRVVRQATATFDRKWAETLTDATALQEALDVVREVVEVMLKRGAGPDGGPGPDPSAELADWW